MLRLNRNEYLTTESYAYHLYNDLGCTDVAFAIVEKGGYWSKWYTYHKLMHLDSEDYIDYNSCRQIKVKEFWKLANNRTILDIEILFDIDEVNKSQDLQLIKEQAHKIVARLRTHKLFNFVTYFTGSKSYHVSLLVPELRDVSRLEQRRIKELILKMGSADILKASNKTMISLEGVPHYKSSKIKKEVGM